MTSGMFSKGPWGTVAWFALVVGALWAPVTARAAATGGAGTRPDEAQCRKACEHKLSLSTGHMAPEGRDVPPEVARMLEDLPKACMADCGAGRLDPACLLRAKAVQQTGVCEYYVWIPADKEGGAAKDGAAKGGESAETESADPSVGAESVEALAAALRKAVLEGKADEFRKRFMPIEALLGCPTGMFGGTPPKKLRAMRAQTLKTMAGLVSKFDVIHEKPLVSSKDREPIEDGSYWTHYGLDPLPRCAIRGQLVARLPAKDKEGKMGNLALLAVKVGTKWYHLGMGFAGW